MRAIHVALAAVTVASACAPHVPSAPHASTGRDESALRAAFDADADRPRIVLLLSPT